MKKKMIRSIFCTLFLGFTLLCGCAKTAESEEKSIQQISDTEIISEAAPEETPNSNSNSEEQTNQSSQADETVIELMGDSIRVSGEGAEADGSTITITQAGSYRISGTLDDGQILVNAKGSEVVLILDGMEIRSSQGSPICITKASSVTISAAAETENLVVDAAEYILKNGEDEPDGAIYSSADLIFNGQGTLTVNGNYSKSVHGKDNVYFEDGTYVFSSVGDAVKGKDAVQISGGSLTIDAGEDGIQSNNDEDSEMGNISITGGNISITAGNDGIQAETLLSVSDAIVNVTAEEDGFHSRQDIRIESGTITIVSGEDGMQADGNLTFSGGNCDIQSGGGSAEAPEHTENIGFAGWFSFDSGEDADSAKGLKSGGNLIVSGGVLTLDCLDDAIHCAENLTVTGNTDITVSTGDDAFHSDETLEIESGTISVVSSYEGLEAVFIEISGGDISIVSSDDGLNAAGGDSVDMDFSFMGMYGSNPETPEDATYYIWITGGTMFVDAGGDGIDSNGALFVDGGDIVISGPTSSANGAIDYTTTGQITGGTIVAAGASGMAQNFDASSTQASLMYTLANRTEESCQVMLMDADGNILVNETMTKNFDSLVISMPELQVGETYTLSCDDESLEVTLTDTITTVGGFDGSGFGSGSLPDGGRDDSVPDRGADAGGPDNSVPDRGADAGGMGGMIR